MIEVLSYQGNCLEGKARDIFKNQMSMEENLCFPLISKIGYEWL
jgi:hypothetical protein